MGVVAGQAVQRRKQGFGFETVYAGIDFVDPDLLRSGVFLFNNPADIARRVAQNPAIPLRVGRFRRQYGRRGAAFLVLPAQGLQRGCL